jgi:heat shock protein HslJ
MKYAKLHYTTAVLILTALLAACAPIQVTPSPSGTPTAGVSEEATEEATQEATQEESEEVSLANTQWTLESLGPVEEQTPVVGETPITLEFTNESQIAGSGGCNSYSGDYQIQGGELVVEQIISTLMACVDEDAMTQETAYFDALQSAGEFELTEDHLTIYYEYVPDETNPTQTELGALNFAPTTTSATTEPGAGDETPTVEPGTPAPEANTNPTAPSAAESRSYS